MMLAIDIVVIGLGLALTLTALHHVVEEESNGAWLMVIALVPVLGAHTSFLAEAREWRRLADWEEGREWQNKGEAARRLMAITAQRTSGVRLPAETKEAARLAFRLGRIDDAVSYSEEYLARFEDDHSARYLLARALMRADKPRDALAAFQEVAEKELAFDAGGALMGIARAFVAIGDDVRARMALDEVMARFSYPEARVIAGEIALRGGETDEARRQFQAAIDAGRGATGHRRRLDRKWTQRAAKTLERMKREAGAP
jgi:hypothetical protein